jgi:RNA polymerase sigma-70 factor (ECF subfamily)
MPDDPKDEEIAAKIQQGDIDALKILIDRYEPKMMRYAQKFLFGYEETEDLVQEIFIKAYTNIQGFDTRRKFSAWLYRIAHNEFINALKKKTKEPLLFFDVDVLFPGLISPEKPDRELAENELKELLNQGLNRLQAKYREPLILYYYEELNYQEIAEVMHIPSSTVGIRLKRGKELLKKIYQELIKIYE